MTTLPVSSSAPPAMGSARSVRAVPGAWPAVWALARRELMTYLRLPAGWIIIALMLLMTAFVFAYVVLVPGKPATMRAFFDASGWLLLPVAPAIAMRLFSEELRTGTIEGLLSTPLSTPALVAGKFLGAVLFLVVVLAPTVVLPLTLFLFASPAPDIGPIIAGYAALLLLGVLYLAIGCVASASTSNATLAFLVALFAILGLLLLSGAAEASWVPAWARAVARGASVRPRVDDFAKGIIESAHVVYFVALSAFLLLCAAAVLHLRRAR